MADYGIYYGKNVLDIVDRNEEPLIDSMLWKRDVVFVVGKEKSGKSIWGMQLACSLTTAEPFLDTYKVYKESHVLYLQCEGKRREFQTRLQNMQKGVNCNTDNLTHIFLPGAELDTQKGCQMLLDLLSKHNRTPDIIIVDPLYVAMQGDPSSTTAARSFVNNMRVIAGKYNATVIIIHHAHREKRNMKGYLIDEGDNAIFGSFVWKAYADHVFMLKMDKKSKVYTMTCDTQRSAEVAERLEFKLLSPKIHPDYPLLYTVEDIDSGSSTIRVDTCLRANTNGFTTEEIMEKLDMPRATVYRALRKLQSSSMVTKDTKVKPIVYLSKTAIQT